MSTVAEVLSFKGTGVVTVERGATVLEAARIMNEHRIGSVVVTSPGSGRVVGILTERDVLTRVVTLCKDPMRTLVADVMTTPVQTCTSITPIEEVRRVMKESRIRHVPVVEDNGLRGMVSIGDINAHHTMALVGTVETLEAYISRG